MRVIGIDASLRSTGIGVVESQGSRLKVVEFVTVKNPSSFSHSECLRLILGGLTSLFDRHRPEAAAIEGGFYFKNARTALVLGEVRGVVIAASASAGIPIYEYSPRLVKQALTGFGAAQKDQVSKMVKIILGERGEIQEDAADALAIAICHIQSQTGIAELRPKPI
jgi:crossover junction endodeoxyribonuclease RuvC